MIQKILPRITTRSILQKGNNSKLMNLAGSSMSGWHGPHFEPTEMIIPGGLNFKEKAYFLLKGKLPKSVYERWFPNDDNYIGNEGDQIVTINKAGNYVGSIVESPHDYTITSNETPDTDISDDIINNITNDISGGEGISDGGEDMSALEIFKHLAGLQ